MTPVRLTILLERFAQQEHLLSDTEKDEVVTYLEGHPDAKRQFESLKDFYRDVESAGPTNKDRLDDFVDSLFGLKSVVHLVPLQQRPSAPSERRRPVILAAQTSAAGSPTVRPLATLVAEKDKMVLRIRENLVENTVEFFFLTRFAESRAHSIVVLPSLGSTLLLDAEGRGEIERRALPSELPTHWSAHIHIPVGAITVSKDQAQLVDGSSLTQTLTEGGKVRISSGTPTWQAKILNTFERELRFVVVTNSQEKPLLYRQFEGKIDFDQPAAGDTIRFYL